MYQNSYQQFLASLTTLSASEEQISSAYSELLKKLEDETVYSPLLLIGIHVCVWESSGYAFVLLDESRVSRVFFPELTRQIANYSSS